MSEMGKAKINQENIYDVRSNTNTLEKTSFNNFPLIEKLDGQKIIQAVVMSELLGKPKAKRRKRGRFQ